MIALRCTLVVPLVTLSTLAVTAAGQDLPDYLKAMVQNEARAIRRDVPMTRAIRRAFEAGTRDLSGRPGENYWQLETDFVIEARLDAEACTIVGSETITVHNHSPDELTELALRLDHNLFRPRVPRGTSVPAETTEGMVVTRIAIDGVEVDLTPRRRRRGEGRTNMVFGLDQTAAVLSLAQPIAAGGTARLEVDWHTRLPGGDSGRGHRMTQRWGDTLFQPTQWFPRIAKYDDLRGWDSSRYLGPAEFYNNFGRFDVRLDVPAGWLVTATGVLQNPEEVWGQTARERLGRVLDSDQEIMIVTEGERGAGNATAAGERLVWHFVADKVNDFAWATARDYVMAATRATIPGKGPIPIYMAYLPERARYFQNAGHLSRHALEFYSDLWIPYPFPQLTLQDGPSAGMEYPMVINSNQGAADHEVAHQWWPMMLGTNETWYGWMDEGLNQFMNIYSRADLRGREPNLDGLGRSYGRRSGDESEAPMMWNANYAGGSYGFQTYGKAPLMLSMLGGIAGDEAVVEAIRAYAEAWAFKHPSPWDFVFFMSHALERDLGWFFYYWLWTTESVDGSIEEVRGSGNDTVVVVHQAGQMPSPVVLKVRFAEGGPEIATMDGAEMIDERTALVTWPVDVWFGGQRRFEARLQFGDRVIERVELDPAGRFPDSNLDDNVWERG